MEEKPSPVQHLESIRLEDGKNDESHVFGIDEAHQKKVMCDFCRPLPRVTLTSH